MLIMSVKIGKQEPLAHKTDYYHKLLKRNYKASQGYQKVCSHK